jgi:hypothetical protein
MDDKPTGCVSPQHAGVTGKVENCVSWVFAALVTASGQAWADFDMYMPDCANDQLGLLRMAAAAMASGAAPSRP